MFNYHQIGKYVLLRELPETPLGRNFRAAELGQTGLDKIVHLTRLIDEVTPETKFQHILQSKFDAINPLIHEGINHPFEANNNKGLFISQEYVEGFSIKAILRRCVKNNLPFSIDYALYVTSRICNTIEYTHSQIIGNQPLIHGGLTPYNIYITFDGEIKIMDWAVVATADSMATARSLFLQRYQLYLAPEQAEGRPTTPSIDIFQVGLLFYEMITGSPLYTINRQENVEEMVQELYTLKRVIDGKAIPEEIVNIVAKALSINPDTRYKTIRAMREELDTLLYSGAYLATTTKTSFFINSIYKEEIKKFKENLSNELTLNYAPYLISLTEETGEAEVEEGEESEDVSSASILPEAGEIAAEDEDIVADVGDEFITYTRRRQPRMIPILIIVAAVILSVIVTVLIVGKEEEPEFRPVVSPEDIARKAELERMRKQVDDLRSSIETREQEKLEAESRMKQLEQEVERRAMDHPDLREEDKKIRDALEEERKKREEEEERKKREAEERERRERIARLAAELEERTAGSSANTASEGSGNPAETTTTTPSEGTVTASPEEIPIVPGNDKELVMEPISRTPPQYPVNLRKAGIRISGNVRLLLIIATDGTVESAQVLTGDPAFHAEAQKAALKWRFTPPTKKGEKVRVSMVIAVSF